MSEAMKEAKANLEHELEAAWAIWRDRGNPPETRGEAYQNAWKVLERVREAQGVVNRLCRGLDGVEDVV